MTKYRITNTRSGVELGVYQGESEAEALDAMARDAGYSDYREACAVAPVPDGDMEVTEVADSDRA